MKFIFFIFTFTCAFASGKEMALTFDDAPYQTAKAELDKLLEPTK